MGRKARLDLVLDCSDAAQLTAFWRDALGYRVYFAGEGFAVLVPQEGEGNASPLVLQQVPEPKVGKNRMHLDIVVDEIEPEVERLETVGAHRLHEGIQNIGDTQWVTLADPEGNEFCVCTGIEY